MTARTLLVLAALSSASAACSSSTTPFEAKVAPALKVTRNADGSIDDRSMCEWKGRADREASETAGPGAIQPNVRRVWQLVGTGEDRHKVLICREMLSGVRDRVQGTQISAPLGKVPVVLDVLRS